MSTKTDNPIITMHTERHGDFSVTASDLSRAYAKYGRTLMRHLRAEIEDRTDGEDWSDIGHQPATVIILACLDVELAHAGGPARVSDG